MTVRWRILLFELIILAFVGVIGEFLLASIFLRDYGWIVPVTVAFGAPITTAGRFEGVPLGRARRELTDELMDAIAALSGQERAPGYNERSAAT